MCVFVFLLLLLNICIYFSPLPAAAVFFSFPIVSFLSLLLINILHALATHYIITTFTCELWARGDWVTYVRVYLCLFASISRICICICIYISSKVNVRFALLLACLSLV